MVVLASEVRKKGFAFLDNLLSKLDEVIISFKGKKKFVVMDIKRYETLRKIELENMYKLVQEDIKKGKFHTDLDKHLKEIENV